MCATLIRKKIHEHGFDGCEDLPSGEQNCVYQLMSDHCLEKNKGLHFSL